MISKRFAFKKLSFELGKREKYLTGQKMFYSVMVEIIIIKSYCFKSLQTIKELK